MSLDVKHLNQPIDFFIIYAIMCTVRKRKDTSQTRKVTTMKKSSLQSLVNYLNGESVENIADIKAELEAELSRGQAKAEATKAAYAAMHDPVMEAIRVAGKPVSAADIATEAGLSRSKVSYALNNYWVDEVNVDDSGKAKLYSLKEGE
jgi:DNA-binding transcriptional regulator GbsR (MarR family)